MSELLQMMREELELARITLRVQELLDKLELSNLERDEARDTVASLRNELRAVRATLGHRERVGGLKEDLDLARQQCADARNELYRLQRSIETTLSLCGGDQAPASVRDLVVRYNEQRRLLQLDQVERDEARDRLHDAVAAERERCAKVCDMVRDDIVSRCLMHTSVATAERCALEIRAIAKGA